MLILERHIGQKIIINNDITVWLIGINGNKARLGFEAPKTTIIDREEIHYRRLDNPFVERKNECQHEPEINAIYFSHPQQYRCIKCGEFYR